VRISLHPAQDPYQANIKSGFRAVEVANMRELAALTLHHTWSPIVWRNGERNAANFLAAEVIALDFDEPGFSIADAQRVSEALGLPYFIGTTKSHQKEKRGVVCDRFRWVFSGSAPCRDAEAYRHNMTLLMKKFPSADRSGKDAARFFFRCSEIVSGAAKGDAYEWEPLPMGFAEKKARRESRAAAEHREIPRHVARWLKRGVGEGESRHHTCTLIGLALAERGFQLEEIEDLIRASPLASVIVDDPHDWLRTIQWGLKKARGGLERD